MQRRKTSMMGKQPTHVQGWALEPHVGKVTGTWPVSGNSMKDAPNMLLGQRYALPLSELPISGVGLS
jgi:hypothetical protein